MLIQIPSVFHSALARRARCQDVTGLLKLYLKELPDSLFTSDYYKYFASVGRTYPPPTPTPTPTPTPPPPPHTHTTPTHAHTPTPPLLATPVSVS